MILQAKDLKERDRNFVTDSWLKSYRSSPEAKYYLTSIYKNVYFNYITKELEVCTIDIEKEDDGDRIKGYCVYEPMKLDHKSEAHSGEKNILKYIYTSYNYRNKGIANNFMETYKHKDYIYASYINGDFVKICKKKKLKHVYLPYLKKLT